MLKHWLIVLSIFTLFSFVYADDTNECEKAHLRLSKDSKIPDSKKIFTCKVNSQGRINYLKITSNYVICPSFSQYTDIEELELGFTVDDIEVDYDSLKKLTKLTNLKIDGSFIIIRNPSTIPEVILSLTNLKKLAITNNDIVTIPDSISNLKDLEYLDLSNNLLTSVPEKLAELKNLKYLNLNNNNIESIPESIKNLPNIKEIYINGKNIIEKTDDNDSTDVSDNTESNNSDDIKISTNNRCGKDYGKCPDGYCCSKYGWCGTSEAHCTDCLSEYGQCKSVNKGVSTTGKCGPSDGKCAEGYCCSKYGWCGKTKEYCSTDAGCQSEFGQCTKVEKVAQLSTDGQCGDGHGRCPEGECCSKYGWCGHSEEHCATNNGCKPEYGICNSNIAVKTGECGKGLGKCPKGECCSKYGWCGKNEKYCGAGCQSEFGECH